MRTHPHLSVDEAHLLRLLSHILPSSSLLFKATQIPKHASYCSAQCPSSKRPLLRSCPVPTCRDGIRPAARRKTPTHTLPTDQDSGRRVPQPHLGQLCSLCTPCIPRLLRHILYIPAVALGPVLGPRRCHLALARCAPYVLHWSKSSTPSTCLSDRNTQWVAF